MLMKAPRMHIATNPLSTLLTKENENSQDTDRQRVRQRAPDFQNIFGHWPFKLCTMLSLLSLDLGLRVKFRGEKVFS